MDSGFGSGTSEITRIASYYVPTLRQQYAFEISSADGKRW
jgi:hypothetical protein